MFYTREGPILCRFGPCQFNGSAMVCRGNIDMLKQSSGHDPPRRGGGTDVDCIQNDIRDTKPRQRNPSGSCLKSPTGSPPSSPTRKSVRFADSIGMELEAVRMFEKCDSDYELTLPDSFVKSVYRSRRFMAHCQNNRVPSEKYLEPCFQIPDCDLTNTLHEKKVCLESYEVKDLSVKATVRVANIAFKKSVKVRFTITDWATHYDLPARYIENSNDGHSDKFTFEISLPRDFVIGCRLEFALQYEVDGQTFWDNNSDENYAYECTDTRRTSRPWTRSKTVVKDNIYGVQESNGLKIDKLLTFPVERDPWTAGKTDEKLLSFFSCTGLGWSILTWTCDVKPTIAEFQWGLFTYIVVWTVSLYLAQFAFNKTIVFVTFAILRCVFTDLRYVKRWEMLFTSAFSRYWLHRVTRLFMQILWFWRDHVYDHKPDKKRDLLTNTPFMSIWRHSFTMASLSICDFAVCLPKTDGEKCRKILFHFGLI